MHAKGRNMNDSSPEADKLKGSTKSAAGKASGDKGLEAEGKTDRIQAEGRQAAEEIKDAARGAAESLKNGPKH